MKIKRDTKKRIFDIIQIGTRVDIPSRAFDFFIVCAIITSISVIFLQTFDSMAPYAAVLDGIEFATIIIFIIEYLLRLWTSDLLYPQEKGLRAVGRFLCSFYGVVDLLTIVSYFAPLYSNGIVALRMIRVIRIMRLFRVNQSFDAFNIVAAVVMEKKKQLMSSICMIAMIMLAASLCMYGFEHDVQPEVFENAFSGIWWAMSTVLTVGYGDIYPITIGGKLVAIIIALLGVCVVAIPTGVISAGFVEYYARLRGDAGSFLEGDTLQMLEKRAAKRDMSVGEYILYLMGQDMQH
ncbi:MAG: ion transporter [Butyrivibrio sp.]|nr:ion transporter [Muribaculum sp.]MCM1551215.1 ion transporter [Butyrivibrio sp.]